MSDAGNSLANHLLLQRERMKRRLDARRRAASPSRRRHAWSSPRGPAKLAPHYLGPFAFAGQINDVPYERNLPGTIARAVASLRHDRGLKTTASKRAEETEFSRLVRGL